MAPPSFWSLICHGSWLDMKPMKSHHESYFDWTWARSTIRILQLKPKWSSCPYKTAICKSDIEVEHLPQDGLWLAPQVRWFIYQVETNVSVCAFCCVRFHVKKKEKKSDSGVFVPWTNQRDNRQNTLSKDTFEERMDEEENMCGWFNGPPNPVTHFISCFSSIHHISKRSITSGKAI